MSWQYVEVNRRGRVAVVSFDRGDRLNALSRQLMLELTEAARSFEDDLETTAVVLHGAGEGFSAGFDLRDAQNREVRSLPLGERRRVLAIGPKMCRAWEEVPQLTVCAVEGFCIGGAVSLAVSCDFRVLAEGGHMRVPELELGMNMSWQTLPRLTRLVGPARAKEIVILAEAVGAEAALAWGLVERTAPDGEALAVALELAGKAAAKPPIPVRMTKQAVNAASSALDHATSFMDGDQFALCQTSEDHAEGVAAYLERRPPDFKGA
jgi:enoyl-CoA hydratase/carnithine racemase